MRRTTKKWAYLGMAALLAFSPVLAAGAEEEAAEEEATEEVAEETVEDISEYFGHVDDVDQTLYFQCVVDDEIEEQFELPWSPYETSEGHDWYCSIIMALGDDQGHTVGICDEDGVVYGTWEISFENPDLTEYSTIQLWFYLDRETGDIRTATYEYPYDMDINDCYEAVAYAEDGEEAESIFLTLIDEEAGVFAGTFENLAPGSYTVDLLCYLPKNDEYVSYAWNEEWEQTEQIPVQVSVEGDEFSLQAAEEAGDN